MKTSDTPFYVVGEFLNKIFRDSTLPRRCNSVHPPNRIGHVLPKKSNNILHFCPEYPQAKIIRVIIEIYDGIPESFEVFHCQSTTTEEQLDQFMKKASIYARRYLVLDVNTLPYKLQEVSTS